MVSGHYANIEQGTPLRSLLPADRFRTVSQETRDTVPLTPNEVAVTVVMKPAFVKRLHFPVPWDGILYGWFERRSCSGSWEQTQTGSSG